MVFLPKKNNWGIATILSLLSFLLSTYFWNHFNLSLLPSVAILGCVICIVLWLMPRGTITNTISSPPKWDLPGRMILATLFVLGLTTFANHLGPHLSGLIAPFPIFGTIIAAFTHRQQGPDAAARLLRGVVFGSLSYAAFFLIAGSLLTVIALVTTYTLATIGALGVSAGTFIAPGLFRKYRASRK